ncbi:MAG TPA: carbon monoxide dehydrogenase subunit G [Rhodothermales bacterium]|nr:carbon monoxide dehydrogenase subunit G [Rhodothermales bacterium]
MQVSGDYTFEGPRDEVWELLQDPDVLVSAMPGAKKLDKTGEDEYKAQLQVRVGPVNGVFNTKISLSDKVPPEHYTMHVDSSSPQGFAKGTAEVTLTEQDANTTLMEYDANLQVGGRLASVGQRMLDTVSKSLIRQSLEAMNQALQARLDAGKAAAEPESGAGGEATTVKPKPKAAYTPPSQADFARGVAKDVVVDTVQTNKTALIIGGIVVIVIIGWLVLR